MAKHKFQSMDLKLKRANGTNEMWHSVITRGQNSSAAEPSYWSRVCAELGVVYIVLMLQNGRLDTTAVQIK